MNADSEALEQKIMKALGSAPDVAVPEGFAARLARSLPPQPALILTPARFGVGAAMVCLVVLVALMLLLTPRAVGSSALWISIESIFCAQFACLAVWLVARTLRFSSSL